MTISFVGFGATTYASTDGTKTVACPDGILAGDLVVLVATYYGGTVDPPTALASQGWTDGASPLDDIGTYHQYYDWWYLTAATNLSSADTVTIDVAGMVSVSLNIFVVRGVDPGETLSVYLTDNAESPALPADTVLQPQAQQATAAGLLVGVATSFGVGATRLQSDPADYVPSVGLHVTRTRPVILWATDVLTGGPSGVVDAPITLNAEGDALFWFSWLTFWIDAAPDSVGGDCLLFPADEASIDGITDTARAGFCSDSYVVLATDGANITFSVTLTTEQATVLNTGPTFDTGVGWWIRGFILTDDDYDQATVVGVPQLTVEINGGGGGGATMNLPEIAAAATPDPTDWQLVQTPFGGDWVPGVNTIVISLVDASFEYSPGVFSTLSVYLDLILLALCTPTDVDGCPTCSDCSESCVTEVVTIRDFPVSGTATISGRPPLLCAQYAVWILDRRTHATVLKLPLNGWNLKYNRRIDRTSNASLVVDYTAEGQAMAECCSRLGYVGEWMHELVIQREGNPQETWGGPITGLEDDPKSGRLTLSADDRSAWWDERALPYDLSYVGVDVHGNSRARDAARVFVELLRAAEQPSSYLGRSNAGGQVLPYDPVGLQAHSYPTGVMIDKKVLLKADDVIIGEELRSLASATLDWTVVGRRVYIGALVINLDPLPLLKQEHWVEHDPVIARQGRGVVTKVVVRGQGDVRGEYPPGQIVTPRWPQYGSHFKRIRDSTITDNQVATERARSYWERWQQPNFQVLSSRGSLGPLAPVSVEDLIPGRAVQVAITEGCMPTSLKLAEQRVGGRVQYYAYDSGQPQPLVVAQRIVEVNVEVEDSFEKEVRIDTQALGTERRTRGRIDWTTGTGVA